VRRRAFIAGLGSAACTVAANAEDRRKARIGILTGRAPDDESFAWIEALRKRLQELGWDDGGNVRIDVRADGNIERWQSNARELVASVPDVIVVVGNPAVVALIHETRALPIVFVQVGDPVGSGFVTSLSHPGGNVTGFMHFEPAMGGKWLEMLKQIAPDMTRALVLLLPEAAANVEFLRAAQAAGPAYNVMVDSAGIHSQGEIENAITSFARDAGGGLILLPNPISGTNRTLLANLAIQHHLPTIGSFRYMALSGALASYGIDVPDLYRRAAEYVDRILRGEKPATLPVQGPTKLELVINLRTAKAIGLDISSSLLARADEVIE
jgi:putative tryptophan/tyrosine transport system substrate-binding protein